MTALPPMLEKVLLQVTNFPMGLRLIFASIFVSISFIYVLPFLLSFGLATEIASPIALFLGAGVGICLSESIVKLSESIVTAYQKAKQERENNSAALVETKRIGALLKNNFLESLPHLNEFQINYLEEISKKNTSINEHKLTPQKQTALTFLLANDFIELFLQVDPITHIYRINPVLGKSVFQEIRKMREQHVNTFVTKDDAMHKELIRLLTISDETTDPNIQLSTCNLSRALPPCFSLSPKVEGVQITFNPGYKEIFEKSLSSDMHETIRLNLTKTVSKAPRPMNDW